MFWINYFLSEERVILHSFMTCLCFTQHCDREVPIKEKMSTDEPPNSKLVVVFWKCQN